MVEVQPREEAIDVILELDRQISTYIQTASAVAIADLPTAKRMLALANEARERVKVLRDQFNVQNRRTPEAWKRTPWHRYVIFSNGEPTGWAMGMFADHAIRNWLGQNGEHDPGALKQDEVERRWKWFAEQGYEVREVYLIGIEPHA